MHNGRSTTPPAYAVDTADPRSGGKLITSLQLMPRLGMCGFICGVFNTAVSNGGVITAERTWNDVEGNDSGLIEVISLHLPGTTERKPQLFQEV